MFVAPPIEMTSTPSSSRLRPRASASTRSTAASLGPSTRTTLCTEGTWTDTTAYRAPTCSRRQGTSGGRSGIGAANSAGTHAVTPSREGFPTYGGPSSPAAPRPPARPQDGGDCRRARDEGVLEHGSAHGDSACKIADSADTPASRRRDDGPWDRLSWICPIVTAMGVRCTLGV
jgi:hypothetical protein